MSDKHQRQKHPSGKSLRRDEYRRVGFPRPPPNEPLTPGLRKENMATAIGFVQAFDNIRDGEE